MDSNKNWAAYQQLQQAQQAQQPSSQQQPQQFNQETFVPNFQQSPANFAQYPNIPMQNSNLLQQFDPRFQQWLYNPQISPNMGTTNSPVSSQNSMPQNPMPQNFLTQNGTPFFPYGFQMQYPPFSPLSSSSTASPAPSQANAVELKTPTISQSKRPRITYTPAQVHYLETWYNKSSFISTADRNQIAKELNVYPDQIRIWFQNRRARNRRQNDRLNDSGNSTGGSLNSSNESNYTASPLTLSNESTASVNVPTVNSSFVAPLPNGQANLSMYQLLLYNQQNAGGSMPPTQNTMMPTPNDKYEEDAKSKVNNSPAKDQKQE